MFALTGSTALADGPATGEYTLQVPNAGSNGGPSGGAKIGNSGGSDSALPVVLLAAAAIAAGAGSLAYVRYRRRTGATT